MVRADYCGDGTSYTQNGTPIDLYDGLILQVDTEPGWLVDAEWGTAGARCVKLIRWGQLRSLVFLEPREPQDVRQCLELLPTGTLLIDKHDPSWQGGVLAPMGGL